MKNTNFREQKFSYYEYGIHTADVVFNQDGVMYRKKDIYTNVWSSFSMFKSGEGMFNLPLVKLWRCYEELQSIDWNASDKVCLSTGEKYSRYLKLEDTTEGGKKEVWIWALSEGKFPIDLVVSECKVVGYVQSRRDGCIIMVEPGFEGSTPLKYWNDSSLSKADYAVEHLGKFSVTMGDGVNLATEVWLPSGIKESGKVPAILLRTPYGRLKFGEVELRFVQRGYALVSQDTRGREDSEGEWIPFIHEIDDGDDTLNWIAAQPWCDGNIGMIGGSYCGYVQWAAAAKGNPHLKAMVSQVTAGSPFVDLPRKGGTVMSGTLAWGFMMADRKMNLNALNRDDWDEVLSIRPIKDLPARALGKDVYFWNQWMNHPDNDEFWKKADWSLYGENIDVPCLFISGWYDDDGAGTTQAWEMNERNKRENQMLILGPWYHQANSTRQIHNVQFGDNALRYDLDLLYLRWFDRFLKGILNEVEREPRVQYYMVGENQWKNSAKWYPDGAEYTDFYLASGGSAKTRLGDGSIEKVPQENQGVDSYLFDPKDPAPYLIDVSENECSVPENYKDIEMREDVLVYTSEALEKDMAIAGDIYGVLYASSSAKDTDWVMRLTDVDEEGNSIRLSDGIIRARYRNSFENPELLKPGEIEKYEIKMSKIANLFKKGHRIRVEVTSGVKNLAFANHNTGNDPAGDIEMIVAEQRIYHDEKYPSHVKLPIIASAAMLG